MLIFLASFDFDRGNGIMALAGDIYGRIMRVDAEKVSQLCSLLFCLGIAGSNPASASNFFRESHMR
ncbi:hypothetical protein Rhal01_01162 [Rubritalea halochordaticola]|uniref:Uncharacterized protein n=1 Tax=Rubritalea halochordaticola TaxID=714537 RepID=A0ABP9UWY9_9BACT